MILSATQSLLGLASGMLVGFSLATIVLGFIYPFAPSEALLSLVGFALVTCVYVMVAVAWALYVPELFPTEIRMRGAGFCNTMGRLMTIITPQIVPVIFLRAGVVGVVAMLAALLLIQAIAVAFFAVALGYAAACDRGIGAN